MRRMNTPPNNLQPNNSGSSAAHCLIVEDLPQTAKWLGRVVAQVFPQLQTQYCTGVQAAKARLETYTQPNAPQLDLVLLDLGLPDGCGGDLLPWLAENLPQTITVVATIYDDDNHVFKALAAGAKGYLLKDESAEMLAQYLGRISCGEPPLAPAIARRILQHFHVAPQNSLNEQSQAAEFLPSGQALSEGVLSPREAQTLQWIAQGLTVAECAQKMQLSPLTVAGYVKKIYQKLQISTRAEATREAIKLGMI